MHNRRTALPILPGFRCTFAREYTWVNQGKWSDNSVEAKVVDFAKNEAFKEGPDVYDNVYGADVTIILRQPCEAQHIELCWHATIGFYKGDAVPEEVEGELDKVLKKHGKARRSPGGDASLIS